VDSAKKSQAIRTSTSAPSGIAQLRKSVDLSAEQNADPMNLDDFLVPTSIASPAGISPAPMPETATSQRLQSAVPLNVREKPHVKIPTVMPASSVPKSSLPTMRREFDYVQKRVRKTSIDERRV
jgi:GATA-binding protein